MAVAESVIFMILSIAIIPANIIAIKRFYKTKLNKTFFTLVTALCCCNFAMSLIGIFTAVARFTKNHPLGIYGCYLITIWLCSVTTITMMVQALISYERRKVITSVTIQTFHNRVYIMLTLVIIGSLIFWIIFFTFFDGLSYHQVRYDRNTTDTWEVCVGSSIKYVGRNEIVFTLIGFFIPAGVILFNYWYV